MLSKLYLHYDLRFSDKSLEEKYEHSKQNYYRLLLNIVIMYGFMIGLVGWFMNPLNQAEYLGTERIISLILIVTLSFVFLILGRRRPKICQILLVIVVFLFFFGFMETSRNSKNDWNYTLFFIVGMNKEFIGISLVLSKISWKTSSFMLLFMNLLCAFRYSEFDLNYKMKFYPLIQFSLNTLLLSLSAYFMEQFDRENFYKINNYEYSLSCYKDLITNSFPSAVILIKDDIILFHNQQTFNILECNDESLIRHRIDSIDLEETSQKYEIERVKENGITEDCKPINENFNETSIRFPQITNYQSTTPRKYYGIIELEGKKKNLEITMTRILWEHHMALMIIISENEIVQKMKIINEKSEYKDRLLANVSHDLRTPLNGIMGMIRTTIDINEDKQTRK